MTKSEFGIIGQKIHFRRSRITYESFDEFKTDSKSIAMLETVYDDQGDAFFACSYEDNFLPSGWADAQANKKPFITLKRRKRTSKNVLKTEIVASQY